MLHGRGQDFSHAPVQITWEVCGVRLLKASLPRCLVPAAEWQVRWLLSTMGLCGHLRVVTWPSPPPAPKREHLVVDALCGLQWDTLLYLRRPPRCLGPTVSARDLATQGLVLSSGERPGRSFPCQGPAGRPLKVCGAPWGDGSRTPVRRQALLYGGGMVIGLVFWRAVRGAAPWRSGCLFHCRPCRPRSLADLWTPYAVLKVQSLWVRLCQRSSYPACPAPDPAGYPALSAPSL